MLLALFGAACGPSEPVQSPGPKTAPTPSSAVVVAPQPPPPKRPSASEKLQGTWEIVHYQSLKPIPDEAMPLMGTMFNALRISFEGTVAVARIEKVEERMSFITDNENGDEFKLFARGFMFDGSACRFLPDGQVEIKDEGGTWPGLSRLKRIP